MSVAKRLLLALGLIVVGLGICWFAIWKPLEAARNGMPKISYSLKKAFVGPLCVFFGVAVLFFGKSLSPGGGQNPTVLGWVIIVLGFAVGVAVSWWFNVELGRLGYGSWGYGNS